MPMHSWNGTLPVHYGRTRARLHNIFFVLPQTCLPKHANLYCLGVGLFIDAFSLDLNYYSDMLTSHFYLATNSSMCYQEGGLGFQVDFVQRLVC